MTLGRSNQKETDYRGKLDSREGNSPEGERRSRKETKKNLRLQGVVLEADNKKRKRKSSRRKNRGKM